MSRVGIFGGTFSPPHNGHVGAARCFLKERNLDELHVLPAFLPPHKTADSGATVIDRLEMCRLAFGDLEGTRVLDTEIRRGGKSYTVITLREYAKKGIRPELLVGTDMLLSFDTWYEYREIFSLATVVCMRREQNAETGAALSQKAEKFREQGANIVFLSGDVIDISSEQIRENAKKGVLSDLLPPAVADYICQKRLYGC